LGDTRYFLHHFKQCSVKRTPAPDDRHLASIKKTMLHLNTKIKRKPSKTSNCHVLTPALSVRVKSASSANFRSVSAAGHGVKRGRLHAFCVDAQILLMLTFMMSVRKDRRRWLAKRPEAGTETPMLSGTRNIGISSRTVTNKFKNDRYALYWTCLSHIYSNVDVC